MSVHDTVGILAYEQIARKQEVNTQMEELQMTALNEILKQQQQIIKSQQEIKEELATIKKELHLTFSK
ncbi:hypothetical protein AALF20_13735 [Enterococcus avium]|uniref:hypothetical protein n=1 Tax=Enterococcus avium TaxID=33945 RepID=UPI0035120031